MLQSEVDASPQYQQKRAARKAGDRHWLVADPDWHTPSWLTYREVLARSRTSSCRWRIGRWSSALPSPPLRPLSDGWSDRVRLVFWFDN
jgi:hypothetical protein